MPDVRLVRELFPFCFTIDRDMRIAMVGGRWGSFEGSVALGADFRAVFDIERPTGIVTDSDIAARAGDVFLLSLRARPQFKLRGQFVPRPECACGGSLLFVGGPWITRSAELERFGLDLADFPPHDPRGDFLLLLQTQESTLADMKELAARLRTTGAALEARTREMEREMKLRAELEAQLRQSQKMEAIGRLAGGIAHDFNNILMAVQGYVALTLSRVSPSDPVRAWVEEIRKAGDRAANLTRQLLAFSRQQVLRPQALDLAHELHEFERLLRPMLGERIRLVVEADPGLGFVWADASAINQIVMNLALNARDAMPAGGDLVIHCAAVHGAPGGTLREAGFIELSVRDTGVGMDEATLARAFEPFFTTKEPGKGSGLGLAQVYGLVEQCAGTIEVHSAPGEGAHFRVLLPRIEASESAPPVAHVSPQGGRGERLLLVEDEPLVRKLLEQLLSRAGFQVTSASTPNEAMAQVDRDRPFEVLVSDVVMAGMTGPEFAARVEAECGAVPTIFMSGHTEDEAIRSGAMKPHQCFMPKPFAPSELLLQLRRLLDAHGGGARV
jgi:signal transduction histidine kinase/CheY-like chemotaxis protein